MSQMRELMSQSDIHERFYNDVDLLSISSSSGCLTPFNTPESVSGTASDHRSGALYPDHVTSRTQSVGYDLLLNSVTRCCTDRAQRSAGI